MPRKRETAREEVELSERTIKQFLIDAREPFAEREQIVKEEGLQVERGCVVVGSARIQTDVFWDLAERARRHLREETWPRHWQTFLSEVEKLSIRYQEGKVVRPTGNQAGQTQTYKRENSWTTPFAVSTRLRQAGTLRTILFSHPGNADPSFHEFCTPSEEDGYFQGELDGFAMLKKDRDHLIYANPEYTQPDMDRFFEAVGQACSSTKRPFRVMTVVPYTLGRANRSIVGHGVDLATRLPGVLMRELFIIEKGGFGFWEPDFWRTGKFWKGTTNWTVGILMVENEQARRKYPLYAPALMELRQWLLDHAPRPGMIKTDAGILLEAHFHAQKNKGKMTNWRRLGEGVVRVVAQRLRDRVDYKQEYANFCRMAAEVGIMDLQTEQDLEGQPTDRWRRVFLELIRERCDRLGLSLKSGIK